MTTSRQSKGLGTNLNFKYFWGSLPKNVTPRQLSIYSAFWVVTLSACFTIPVAFLVIQEWQQALLALVVISFGTFLITYFVSLYVLEKYIYRRIKLIYKTIHQRKLLSSEKREVVNLDQSIFDEVEQEVAEWAKDKEAEVTKYKEWAEYRRQFVGDISHELKTPVFIIQSYVDTLLDGSYKDEDISLKFLKKTEKGIERLSTIIQDLEAIARLESGEMMLDMRAFDIKELAQSVFEELELQANQRNIKLQLKEGADTPFRVFADEEKIHQILTNLVNNSIKYGHENGKTKVSFYDMDQRILVEVSDNGIGIPKEHLKHVFDRFYRVDKSRSRQRGGSGLGLSIVKHILEVHDQNINVRSSPGLGTTFGFTLDKVK